MKEHGAGKHYLNWAISRDDYVAVLLIAWHRCAMVKRVASSNKKFRRTIAKSSKFPREMSSLIKRYGGACAGVGDHWIIKIIRWYSSAMAQNSRDLSEVTSLDI